MRIAFFGSSEFVIPIIESISLSQEHKLEFIVTQPDHENRGKIIQNPISVWADQHDIKTYKPSRIRKEIDTYRELLSGVDIAIVASFGQIIPHELLIAPQHGIINWHPSALPQYRGATPMQTAIANGDKETALTWIKMGDGMDDGNILLQKPVQINDDMLFEELAKQMGMMGAQSWTQAIEAQVKGHTVPQHHDLATFTKLLRKEDALVDPSSKTASEIKNHFRSYHQFPKTKIISPTKGEYRLDAIGESIEHSSTDEWFQITDNGIRKTYMQCANNTALEIKKITLTGGKVLDLKGYQF